MTEQEKQKINVEVNIVKTLGESMGYGHLMSIASALWRKSLKDKGYPESGAFVPTCLDFIEKEVAEGDRSNREMYDKFVQGL